MTQAAPLQRGEHNDKGGEQNAGTFLPVGPEMSDGWGGGGTHQESHLHSDPPTFSPPASHYCRPL